MATRGTRTAAGGTDRAGVALSYTPGPAGRHVRGEAPYWQGIGRGCSSRTGLPACLQLCLHASMKNRACHSPLSDLDALHDESTASTAALLMLLTIGWCTC